MLLLKLIVLLTPINVNKHNYNNVLLLINKGLLQGKYIALSKSTLNTVVP